MVDDPAFLNYGRTVLRFETGLQVDLRCDVDADTRAAILALGLGRTFAVITAYNPHGGAIDDDDNERRQARLIDEVAQLGAPYLRVAGTSPDGEHCEDSVAVDVPLADACAIAARFGQTAIYWFDGDRFMLHGAAAGFPPVELPAGVDTLREASRHSA